VLLTHPGRATGFKGAVPVTSLGKAAARKLRKIFYAPGLASSGGKTFRVFIINTMIMMIMMYRGKDRRSINE